MEIKIMKENLGILFLFVLINGLFYKIDGTFMINFLVSMVFTAWFIWFNQYGKEIKND